MSRVAFLLGAAAASIFWAAIYYWLGYVLGAGAAKVIEAAAGRAIQNPEAVAAVVVAAACIAATVISTVLWRRKRAR